jgi:murein DD-endopeptidase MepM/ murein hydrolase activator NlpD
MATNNEKWWEEEDKYGYTYSDINRPGYIAPPQEEEVSEEALEMARLREPGGYEDPEGGDNFEVENIEKDNYDSFQPEIEEAARQSEMMEVGEDFKLSLPNEVDDKLQIPLEKSAIAEWMKKHNYSAEDMKKPDGSWYHPGDVLQSGSEVASEATTETSKSPGVVQSYVTEGTSYEDAKKIKNKKDRIKINVPKFGEWTITETFNAVGPHSNKKPFNYLKDGKIVKHPGGKVNLGLDLINSDMKMKSFLGGTVLDKIESSTGYGNRVIIQTNKFITVDGKQYPLFQQYSHAKDFNIDEGADITDGQHIGTVGNTGASRGAHLDLRSWINIPGKGRVEISPEDYFSLIGKEDVVEEPYTPPLRLQNGGHVKKYGGGGQVLTAGNSGGGVLEEEDFTSYSVEELQEAQKRYPTGSVQRARLNELVGLRMDAEKYEPHSGYKWGGQKDPTGLGASFEGSEIVETDSEGKPVPTEEMKEDAYRSKRGLPTPGASYTHPSQEQHEAGVPESELTPLDPTKSPEYSVMERTAEGKEPGAQVKETEKVTITEDVPPTKTKTQAEIDAEQGVAKAKEEEAWLDQQKKSIAAEIKKFNSEQTELVKIDPNRFWKSKGTISKIAAILGAAGGAYISGRYGGPNRWNEMIDKEITRDIESQKLDRDHAVKKKIAGQKRIEMMMKHYEFMTKDKTAKANLAFAREKLKNERLKGTANHIKEQRAAQDATAMGKGMTDQQLAVYNARYPKQNVRKRAIKSTKNGLWFVFPDMATKKKVTDNLNAGEKALQNIGQLKALVKDISWQTAIPGPLKDFDPKLKRAKVLRESLKGALRLEIFGPGVMTDTERALAEEIIGDPTKLFTTDATQIEMLNTLQAKINYGIRQQLIRAGIAVPPDQNELQIQKMLASKGWTDDRGENRAKVVNALIKLEQKHKTGTFWKHDSQVPL